MTRCSIFEIPAAAEAGATTELVALRFDDLPGLNAANEEVPAADPLRNTLTRADSVLSFPPGGLIGRDEQAILSAFDQRVRHLHSLARAGVYPKCRGQMQTGSKCCLETALRTADTCKQCQHSLLSSPLGTRSP
jgi:hypothetical protein